jgi:hypothetical protein
VTDETTPCGDCGQGPYQAATKPLCAQNGPRVAVVTDVPCWSCPACGHDRIEPNVNVEALVMLAVSLQVYRVSIRGYAEGSKE